ncbi:MAG: PilZ domain-containing protein [Thermodesulfobacteriota bacterium]|nr:MAG: PilZ domain-containing protein [Thermodesulfobacteriota bacterium]
MRLRICPECYKAFFMSFGNERARCPHCGVYLAERRSSERTKKEMDLILSVNGSVYKALTTDFSDSGAGILLNGSTSLEADSMLDVCIEELSLRGRARTVWARKVSRSTTSAGLKLL